MKTNLPAEIKTVKAAKKFLFELHSNQEFYHPEDNAHDLIWDVTPPSTEECDKLNSLMANIHELEDFDPCEYLLSLEVDINLPVRLKDPDGDEEARIIFKISNYNEETYRAYIKPIDAEEATPPLRLVDIQDLINV